ncbi:hypothetical protein ASPBRDRAFT_48504 [Aspergillus brasiliensis CBS 101740]|uniref:Sulfotransferase domain-containing protein n=1 Tax=Aspergillus brasiliensis (strain CBS 101740 / IMI 381727 / IBT 21946) TaxID=767769 RepID=A0A1L9U5K8_ASPBC|nr:hypothetical protein ASPBRDRAFT_48504 [Aspergillus brasiliensis CBS 101740]
MTVTPPPRRVLLVSVPRSASHLLLKIVDIHNQPKFLTNEQGGYFFFPAFAPAIHGGYAATPLNEWTSAQKDEVKASFQGCVDSLEEYSERAQKDNKAMFIKEHAYWFMNPAVMHELVTGKEAPELSKAFQLHLSESSYGPQQSFSPSNKTVLPDEYLRSWQVAFIIRHPALAWASMYRAMTKIKGFGGMGDEFMGVWKTNTTLRWTRMVYDWCLEQGTQPPVLIDADDVTHNPAVVKRFCELTGLDPEKIQYEWSEETVKGTGPGMHDHGSEHYEMQFKINCVMRSTVDASSGIIKDKTPTGPIDIDVEVQKWKAELGDEAAQLLQEAVLESMSDYEYLKERRIVV